MEFLHQLVNIDKDGRISFRVSGWMSHRVSGRGARLWRRQSVVCLFGLVSDSGASNWHLGCWCHQASSRDHFMPAGFCTNRELVPTQGGAHGGDTEDDDGPAAVGQVAGQAIVLFVQCCLEQ